MCSPTGLICILIASLFYNFIIYPTLASASAKVDIINSDSNTATNTSIKPHRNTTSNCSFDGCPQGGHSGSSSSDSHTSPLKNRSVYTPYSQHLHYLNAAATTATPATNGESNKRNDGHFIDITRKQKIHYNGIVVSVFIVVVHFFTFFFSSFYLI